MKNLKGGDQYKDGYLDGYEVHTTGSADQTGKSPSGGKRRRGKGDKSRPETAGTHRGRKTGTGNSLFRCMDNCLKKHMEARLPY